MDVHNPLSAEDFANFEAANLPVYKYQAPTSFSVLKSGAPGDGTIHLGCTFSDFSKTQKVFPRKFDAGVHGFGAVLTGGVGAISMAHIPNVNEVNSFETLIADYGRGFLALRLYPKGKSHQKDAQFGSVLCYGFGAGIAIVHGNLTWKHG